MSGGQLQAPTTSAGVKSISDDTSFKHIDSLNVPNMGQFELFLRNQQNPRWILAKRLDAQKRPQNFERANVLNKIASSFPPEVTAGNPDYRPLAEPQVRQVTNNLFGDPKNQTWNYFEHSGANLLEVTQRFKTQGLKYADSDLFAITGFLIDAGRKLEDVLGHHSHITQSSVLIKPNGKLSLMNPLINDTQISGMDVNLASKIVDCGPAFTQEMYLNRDARKAAEKSDQRIKSINAWHRGEIMMMIDHCFILLLSLLMRVDDKVYFKDSREYSQDQVSKDIEFLKSQNVNGMLLDFLQHVLLQQAYDSFKKLSLYIATNTPLQTRIMSEYSRNLLTSNSVNSDPSNQVVNAVHEIQSTNLNVFAPPPIQSNNLAVQNANPTLASTSGGQHQWNHNFMTGTDSSGFNSGQVFTNTVSTQGTTGFTQQTSNNLQNQQAHQTGFAGRGQAGTGLLSQFSHQQVGGTQQVVYPNAAVAGGVSSYQSQTGNVQQQQTNQRLDAIGQFLGQQSGIQSSTAARQAAVVSPNQSFGYAYTSSNAGNNQAVSTQQQQQNLGFQGQVRGVNQEASVAGHSSTAVIPLPANQQQFSAAGASSSNPTLPLAMPVATQQSSSSSTQEVKFYSEQIEILKHKLAEEQIKQQLIQQQAEAQIRVQNEALVKAHAETELIKKQQAEERAFLHQQIQIKAKEAEEKALSVAEAQARAFAQSQIQQSQAHQQALLQAKSLAEQEGQRKAFMEAELQARQQQEAQTRIQEQRMLEAQQKTQSEIRARFEAESKAAQVQFQIESERQAQLQLQAQAEAQAQAQRQAQVQMQARLSQEALIAQQQAPLVHTNVQQVQAGIPMMPIMYMPVAGNVVPVMAQPNQFAWNQQSFQAPPVQRTDVQVKSTPQLSPEIVSSFAGLTASMGQQDRQQQQPPIQQANQAQANNFAQRQPQSQQFQNQYQAPPQPTPPLQPQAAPRTQENPNPSPPVLGPSQKQSILKPSQQQYHNTPQQQAPRHATFADTQEDYSEEEGEPHIQVPQPQRRVKRSAQSHVSYAAPTYVQHSYVQNPVRRSVVVPTTTEYVTAAPQVYQTVAAPQYYTEAPITYANQHATYARAAPRRSIVRSPVIIPAATDIYYEEGPLEVSNVTLQDHPIRVTHGGLTSASSGALRVRPLSSSRRITPSPVTASAWTLGEQGSSSYLNAPILAPGIVRSSHNSVPRSSYTGVRVVVHPSHLN